MSAHTPGPWKKEPDESPFRRVFAGDKVVTEVWTTDDDARLIAAAPALLAVLELLVATAESAVETNHSESTCIAANWDVLGAQVRAAIRAAKGEGQ